MLLNSVGVQLISNGFIKSSSKLYIMNEALSVAFRYFIVPDSNEEENKKFVLVPLGSCFKVNFRFFCFKSSRYRVSVKPNLLVLEVLLEEEIKLF